MFKRLRRLFGSSPQAGPWFKHTNRDRDAASVDDSAEVIARRRWDAGKTDRLNSAHWGKVTGQTINMDLAGQHEMLRTRVEFELSNNADAEGAVNTHIVDVIGEDGPKLQVQSGSPDYNEKLERIWRNWWAKPDINEQLSGVEILDLWWRSLWSAGEYLGQIVTDRAADGPIKSRILPLHARRLATPAGKAFDGTIFMGVKRNTLGRHLAYMILAPPETSILRQLPTQFDEIPARDIIHGYRVLEAGQVRGVPWLVTGLPAIADMRDFDNEVLDAARAAADSGAVMHTDNIEAGFVEVNETTEIERRTLTTLPPGYKMTQMVPQQPATNYIDYHDEQLRKVGRPVGMPLMIVKMDSRKHNFSSARLDGQMYQRSTKKLRAWLTRTTLNRLVRLVAREAQLAGVLPEAPGDVYFHWNWTAFPHVDPVKEGKATTERLKNTTSTMRDECADRGTDWEEVLDQQKREQEERVKRDLPPLESMLGVPDEPETPEQNEEATANVAISA